MNYDSGTGTGSATVNFVAPKQFFSTLSFVALFESGIRDQRSRIWDG